MTPLKAVDNSKNPVFVRLSTEPSLTGPHNFELTRYGHFEATAYQFQPAIRSLKRYLKLYHRDSHFAITKC